MSDLVGNPEEWFSHNEAHIETMGFIEQKPAQNIKLEKQFRSKGLGVLC